MAHSLIPAIEVLVSELSGHAAPFYREQWRSISEFSRLPTTNRDDFIRTPLARRSYKLGDFVKIVTTTSGVFLSAWSLQDIAQEPYGVISKRPGVCVADGHEAMEKALWCYEHDCVPLCAEQAPDLMLREMETYNTDSIITDAQSIGGLVPYLSGHTLPLKGLSVFGTSFPLALLGQCAPFVQETRLVLSLPETGAFAVAEFSAQPKFLPLPDCYIEEMDGELVLTKLHRLVTPIVRYKTGVRLGQKYSDGFSVA